MTSASGANYYYNGDGQRVGKAVGGNTTVDATDGNVGRILTEVVNGTWNKEYFYVNGLRIASHENDSTWVHYYFHDHLGTPRLLLTPAWNTPIWHDYEPFGQEVTSWSDTKEPFKFTGQYRDAETGNDNFGARYYGSSMGRFLSPDPSMAFSIREINPQRWNQYAYAINNPLSYNDPTGNDAIAVTFTTMVAHLGHEGIISVGSDGNATYARFGPTDHGLDNLLGAYGPVRPIFQSFSSQAERRLRRP